MSKIKVYVRVRPPLPGEFDTPGCFNCTELEDVSGNWIRIKKEGEQTRYFARVWGPNSTQEEMFRTIGINTVNDVFEGYYGCIFVYGQTGTGKTFTLGCLTPGIEGIQPQCIRYMFDRAAKESNKYEVTIKQHYVQLYRDSVQDLLDITKDNLKIRMEDSTGATIEKVTIRQVSNYEESIALIQEGDGNRAVANTKMNSASSRSHACLITEIWRKERNTGNVTFGRLYLIDLAGSERASKSGVTDDAFKEMVAINKSLTTLGNCIAGLVNNEKVVSFRDSPLTRILQHSLTGHGRTSIIVTIRPDSPNMQESVCTLKFGERAQKVEAQMTPAGYRDQVLELQEVLRTVKRKNAMLDQTAAANRRWEEEMLKELEAEEAKAKAQEEELNAQAERFKQELQDKKKEMEDQWKRDEEKINAQSKDEITRLREANMSVIKEIDEKVAEAEKEFRLSLAPAQKRAQEERDILLIAKRKTEQELELVRQQEIEDDPYERARQLEETHKQTIADLKRDIQACRDTRFDGLTLQELRQKLSEYRLGYEFMQHRYERLHEKTSDWDPKMMKRFIEHKYKVPGENEKKVFIDRCREAALDKKIMKEEEDERKNAKEAEADKTDSDNAPPPSDSDAPPSSSYEDSDEDSDMRSDYDSDSSDSDEDTEEEEKEEEETGPIPDNQLFDVLHKDQRLSEMLKSFVSHVEAGTIVYVLQDGEAGGAPSVVRCFMYLDRSKKERVVVCEVNSNREPLREKVMSSTIVRDILNLRLGQSSTLFARALEYSPVIPPDTQMPSTSQVCSLSSLRVFEGRSMSLMLSLDGKPTEEHSVLDVVLDTAADYESWTVTLHRLSGLDPHWTSPMDVRSLAGHEKLNEKELKLCESRHIAPNIFRRVNTEFLENPSKVKRLYLTLFDFRKVSAVDLVHAQHVFLFFVELGLIEQHSVYHVRYAHVQEEARRLEEEAQKLRDLRIRLVNMVRYYRKANFTQVQHFLISIHGKEEQIMEKLLKTLGPEPTASQLQSSTNKNPSDVTNSESAVDEIAAQIQESTPLSTEQLEIAEEERRSKEELQRLIEQQRALEQAVSEQLEKRQNEEGMRAETGSEDKISPPPISPQAPREIHADPEFSSSNNTG